MKITGIVTAHRTVEAGHNGQHWHVYTIDAAGDGSMEAGTEIWSVLEWPSREIGIGVTATCVPTRIYSAGGKEVLRAMTIDLLPAHPEAQVQEGWL